MVTFMVLFAFVPYLLNQFLVRNASFVMKYGKEDIKTLISQVEIFAV